MKITRRQLRRIIREQAGLTGMEIQPSIDAIEEILNGLYDDGLENADLIKMLEDIIESILGQEIFEHDDLAVDMRELAKRKHEVRISKEESSP